MRWRASCAARFWAAGFIAAAAVATETPAVSGGLEEIVVTAEKRSSTVQDTAISMTALSGDQMLQYGITGIVQNVPGLSMRTAGPGQAELEMRGLSSSGGASPTVGFYLDDYPLTAPAAALNGKVVIDPDLFDLNRVAVLRGPQGTLYGSGSMGGGFNPGGNLMLNLPLIDDTLAMRVVASDKFRDGWITRYVESNFPVPTSCRASCSQTI